MVFNEREVAGPRRCEDVGLSNDARSGSSLRNVSQARAANCEHGNALGAAVHRQTLTKKILTSEANPTAVNSAAEKPADTRAEKS